MLYTPIPGHMGSVRLWERQVYQYNSNSNPNCTTCMLRAYYHIIIVLVCWLRLSQTRLVRQRIHSCLHLSIHWPRPSGRGEESKIRDQEAKLAKKAEQQHFKEENVTSWLSSRVKHIHWRDDVARPLFNFNGIVLALKSMDETILSASSSIAVDTWISGHLRVIVSGMWILFLFNFNASLITVRKMSFHKWTNKWTILCAWEHHQHVKEEWCVDGVVIYERVQILRFVWFV